MAGKNGTLLAIAKKEIGKKDNEKALDRLNDAVEANENAIGQELFNAKRDAKVAAKAVTALAGDVTATGAQIIEAKNNAEDLAAYAEDLAAVIEERF